MNNVTLTYHSPELGATQIEIALKPLTNALRIEYLKLNHKHIERASTMLPKAQAAVDAQSDIAMEPALRAKAIVEAKQVRYDIEHEFNVKYFQLIAQRGNLNEEQWNLIQSKSDSSFWANVELEGLQAAVAKFRERFDS